MAAGETMIMIATIMIATVTTDVPRTRQTFNRADIHAGFDQPDVGRLPESAPTRRVNTPAQELRPERENRAVDSLPASCLLNRKLRVGHHLPLTAALLEYVQAAV